MFSARFWVFKLIRFKGIDSFQTECVWKEGIERSLDHPFCFKEYYWIWNKTTSNIINNDSLERPISAEAFIFNKSNCLTVFLLSCSFVRNYWSNKEVFVKHEQAPTAPKTRRVIGFCRFKIYFLWKPLFLANLTASGRVFFDRNGQKAHIRTKTFHLSL